MHFDAVNDVQYPNKQGSLSTVYIIANPYSDRMAFLGCRHHVGLVLIYCRRRCFWKYIPIHRQLFPWFIEANCYSHPNGVRISACYGRNCLSKAVDIKIDVKLNPFMIRHLHVTANIYQLLMILNWLAQLLELGSTRTSEPSKKWLTPIYSQGFWFRLLSNWLFAWLVNGLYAIRVNCIKQTIKYIVIKVMFLYYALILLL